MATPKIFVELYGGYHSTTVEDTDAGHNEAEMDYLTYIGLEDKIKVDEEINAFWHVEAQFKGPEEDDDSEAKEMYAGLEMGKISVMAGRINVGGDDGIIKGNKYMTETGKEYTGKYGNADGEQPNVAFQVKPLENIDIIMGYSARKEDISVETSNNDGNVNVADIVAKANFKAFEIGLEIESKSFEDNDQNKNSTTNEKNTLKNTEVKLGLGLWFSILEDTIMPFINLGMNSENDEAKQEKIDTTERNFGVDILLTRSMGATVGLEMLTRDGEKAQIYYIGVMKKIGENISIGGSYWNSDQKKEKGFDNLKNSIDIELAMKF